MKIKIGEDWLITSDSMNVILNQRYEKQNKEKQPSGEHDWKSVGFYKNLEHACIALIDKGIQAADAENLAEIHAVILDVKRQVMAAMDFMANERIQELQEEGRAKNAIINKVKSLYTRCDNEGRPVETFEIFEILYPEKKGAAAK